MTPTVSCTHTYTTTILLQLCPTTTKTIHFMKSNRRSLLAITTANYYQSLTMLNTSGEERIKKLKIKFCYYVKFSEAQLMSIHFLLASQEISLHSQLNSHHPLSSVNLQKPNVLSCQLQGTHCSTATIINGNKPYGTTLQFTIHL